MCLSKAADYLLEVFLEPEDCLLLVQLVLEVVVDAKLLCHWSRLQEKNSESTSANITGTRITATSIIHLLACFLFSQQFIWNNIDETSDGTGGGSSNRQMQNILLPMVQVLPVVQMKVHTGSSSGKDESSAWKQHPIWLVQLSSLISPRLLPPSQKSISTFIRVQKHHIITFSPLLKHLVHQSKMEEKKSVQWGERSYCSSTTITYETRWKDWKGLHSLCLWKVFSLC